MPSKYTPFDLEHCSIPYGELCQEHFDVNLDIWVLCGTTHWIDENGFYWEVVRYTHAAGYRKMLQLKWQDPEFHWEICEFPHLLIDEVLHGIPTTTNPFGF